MPAKLSQVHPATGDSFAGTVPVIQHHPSTPPSIHMSSWKNRIVGHGEERPDQLLANPFNWKIHTAQQEAAITGILEEIGWVQQVVVNRRTGHLVDGHMRVALAVKYNEPVVPVIYVDLSENEERIVLMTLDTVTAMAGTDKDCLDELLHQANTTDANIQQFLADMASTKGLYKDKSRAGERTSNDDGEVGTSSEDRTGGAYREPDAPEFKEFTEEIAKTVDCHECPACGHRWPK